MPEIHNKREGDMSDEELKQCVLDMETWLVANAGSAGSEFAGAAGASKELIDGLPASAPAALKGLLGVHDGKLPLLDFVGLACAEIVSEASAAKGSGKVMSGIARLPLTLRSTSAFSPMLRDFRNARRLLLTCRRWCFGAASGGAEHRLLLPTTVNTHRRSRPQYPSTAAVPHHPFRFR